MSSVPASPDNPGLFALDPIDEPEAWAVELQEEFHAVNALASGNSSDAQAALQQKAGESMRAHAAVGGGLLYGVLAAETPDAGSAWFRHLGLVTRDGYAHAIGRLLQLAGSTRFGALRPRVRGQAVWLAGALVRANAVGADGVVAALARQIRSGSQGAWMCRQVLQLLEENYAWLTAPGRHVLVATMALTFARLARCGDLMARNGELRDACAAFAVRLVGERFNDCVAAGVGRDLVRVLGDVARLPAVRGLWDTLLRERLHERLLRVPTPRAMLASLLTPDMEARLLFMLEHVATPQHTRYLTWFVHRFLATPEAAALIPDVIRYICGACHPTNAVLASPVVPRYVLVGGILRLVRAQAVAADAKLALFYDWLFYDPLGADSIMNVEPGVLLLARSADKYPFLTASFVEFLAFAADAYAPAMAPAARRSVGLVMRDAVGRGVIPSLMPVYAQPRLSRDTRRHLRLLFPDDVPKDAEESEISADEEEGPDKQQDQQIINGDNGRASPPLQELKLPPTSSQQPVDFAALDPVSRMFHDDDDDDDDFYSEAPPGINHHGGQYGGSDTDDGDNGWALDSPPIIECSFDDCDDDDDDSPPLTLSAILEGHSQFGPTLLRDFVTTKSAAHASEIVKSLARCSENDSPAIVAQAAFVLASVALLDDEVELEDVETNAELSDPENDNIDVEHDLLHAVLTTAASTIVMPGTSDCAANRVLDLLVRLTRARVDVGFRWLLQCLSLADSSNQSPGQLSLLYSRYVARFASSGSLSSALARDLGVLQERFTGLFYQVLPKVYAAFPDHLPGSRRLVRSVVAQIDQPQVYRLNMLATRGLLRLFGRKRAAFRVVAYTMDCCDAFEQVCVWQLLAAEIAGDVDTITRVAKGVLLRKALDPDSNSEAANGLLALMRTVPPTPSLLQIVSRYYMMEDDGAAESATASNGDHGQEQLLCRRADFCGSVLSAWLLQPFPGSRPMLLRALSEQLPFNARRPLISAWVSRGFITATGSDIPEIRALLTDVNDQPPPQPPPPSMQSSLSLEALAVQESNPDMKSSSNSRSHLTTKEDDDTLSKRRRPDDSPPPPPPPPLSRPNINKPARQIVKRRRRNVITSDDDDDDDDSMGERREISKTNPVFSSSPVLSSSSLDSDDSDDSDDIV
ncbi:Integrator complex subunit 3 [Coemansia thaxteri]|nr:Integrator complex subunit 3 [Coemansia thaxteri]